MSLVVALIGGAWAAEVAGVALPDVVRVGDQDLVFNGGGLNAKLGFDLYVGALYLPERCADPAAIIASDAPKRMVMHFVRRLPAVLVRAGIRDGFASVPASEAMADPIDTFVSWVEDADPGEELVFDYVPGEGSVLWFGGRRKGVIPGSAFGRLVVEVFVGDDPPSQALRRGLLGGDVAQPGGHSGSNAATSSSTH